MARKRSRVDLEGVEDLERSLARLTEDVGGVHLRAAVLSGAEIVADVASQLAPRSEDGSHGHKPGFLADNIKAEQQFTRRQDKAEAHVGMDKEAWYGQLQETGTVHQPAQPFLRPALDETKDDVVDQVADELRARILRTVGA